METESGTTGELIVSGPAAGQFCYHVHMAAVFGAAGHEAESASEAVLAWTILAHCWPGAIDATTTIAAELVGRHQVRLSAQHREAARARAQAQALDLQAHYVTVGLQSEAELYEAVAEHVGETVQSLISVG